MDPQDDTTQQPADDQGTPAGDTGGASGEPTTGGGNTTGDHAETPAEPAMGGEETPPAAPSSDNHDGSMGGGDQSPTT